MSNAPLFVHTLDWFASRPCLVDGHGQVWSYAQFLELADHIAKQVGSGRRLVFIESDNAVGPIAALVGCLRAGHVVHLVDAQHPGENAKLVEHYRPHALVRWTEGRTVVDRRHDDDLALHPALAVLLSTSGSTGSRKLVKLSVDNLQANTLSIIKYLGLGSQDRGVTTLKLHYSYGLSVVNTHLAAGASLVLTTLAPHEPGLLPLCAAQGVTNFAGVPYHFETLLRLDARLESVASLRFVTQAGGRLAPELVRRLAKTGRRHGWRFFVMYGQTEAAPRISYLPPELAESHPDAIGVAIPGGSLAIVLDDGTRCTAPGMEGELVYSGPNVMVGYAQSADDLRNVEHIEVLQTGDLAVVDANGLFRITGRRARIAKPLGLRINLDELEAHLQELRLTAAVVAVGERVLVFHAAEVGEAADPAQLLSARFGLPRRLFGLRLVASLPRLASGKTDYAALASLAALPGPGREEAEASQGSFAFARAALREFVSILAGRAHWKSLDDLFAFHFPGRSVSPDQSFQSLGGDSLTYVDMSMALAELYVDPPADWHAMSLRELKLLQLGV